MWRSRLAGLVLGAAATACSAAAGDPADNGQAARPPVDGGGDLLADGGASADATPVAVTLTQSTSQEITPQNSVACIEQDADGNPIEHRENSFYRVFNLESAGVAGRLETSSVSVGIQSADSPNPNQPMSVRLHTLAGNELEVDRLTEIGRADVTVANQGAGILSVPLAATAEAGSRLVVEIFLPDAAGGGNLLFPGSNAGGQSGPTYLRAPAAGCDLVEPTDLADIGFPEMHLVVSVAGTAY
ncbi:MAG TPA: hypothetical protein VFU21_31570 [Kofleriaceae bacterium]|nr:hypothetical protein [Kofleriaceae bacterium]